jgi:hypothetical protein
MPRTYQVFIVQDWKPAATALGLYIEQLGHRVTTLPPLPDLVGQRISRDRPDLIILNASSPLIGDRDQWRTLLSGPAAALIVVPPSTGPGFYNLVRGLGFAGWLDLPMSMEKLELAIHIALQNRLAARTLRREIQRLAAARERTGVAVPQVKEPVSQPASSVTQAIRPISRAKQKVGAGASAG